MRRLTSGRLRFLRTGIGIAGAVVLVIVLAVALFGPFVAPYSPTETVGIPFSKPSAEFPLGLDRQGRDVLSRVLWGGRSVLALAGLATVLAYAVGGLIGLLAGYSRTLLDSFLMRGVDVLMAIPALLFMLVLVTGMGNGWTPLIVGVVVVQAPLIARIIRTATLEQSVRGFVEAAVARGEGTFAILGREILPNIVSPIAADFGLRFTYSIILVASVNFFGLGLQPPSSDWALIVSENRDGFSLNPWVIFVPAAMIALLTIGLNMTGDAIARSLGRSSRAR